MRITLTKTLAGQPAGTQLHVPDTIGDRLTKRGLATNDADTKPAPNDDTPTPTRAKPATKRATKGTRSVAAKGGGDSPSP